MSEVLVHLWVMGVVIWHLLESYVHWVHFLGCIKQWLWKWGLVAKGLLFYLHFGEPQSIGMSQYQILMCCWSFSLNVWWWHQVWYLMSWIVDSHLHRQVWCSYAKWKDICPRYFVWSLDQGGRQWVYYTNYIQLASTHLCCFKALTHVFCLCSCLFHRQMLVLHLWPYIQQSFLDILGSLVELMWTLEQSQPVSFWSHVVSLEWMLTKQ